MPKWMSLLCIGLLAMATPVQKLAAQQNVTVDRLPALLSADTNKSDNEVAAELAGLMLTERLSAARLALLNVVMPGEKSKEALAILADSAAWLESPPGEVPAKPAPDAAALRLMLVNVVNHANATLHKLPNFVATRQTSAFEDRPKEDVQEATAVVSYSYMPLHLVHRSSTEVAYRNGQEILEATGKSAQVWSPLRGLQTAGEFGPFLNTVLADAIKGRITWAYWEQGIDGSDAVFHYSVTRDSSHYTVQFCCIREDSSEAIATHVYAEKTGYHGEIRFDPSTGAVHRITLEAELAPGELVEKAGMLVEYEPVLIGANAVVVPARSVSILRAHTTAPPAGMHMASFKGPAKTFLNEVEFRDYHQFRGEMRILTGDSAGTSPQ